MAEMNQIGPSTVAAVPHPIFVVIYEKKDITADITPYVQEVTYTDYLSGQSDEISIRLEDVDGRWMDAWYPGKTDALHLKFGYEGKPLLACGPFEIDEIEFDLTPSVVTIKALSTGVKSPSRTKSGRAYENTTLAAIAQRIAKRLKLTLTGKIREIPIDRVTQYRETDVGFLTRLAREYGYAFKVVGTKLVFTEQADLRAASAVLTLSRSDLRPGGRLRDKVKDIYVNAKLKHQDTKTKSLIVYGVKDDAVAQVGTTTVSTSKRKASGQGASGDTLYVSARANNKGAAQVKAQAALDAANNEQTAGSLPFIGDIRLVAGIVVALDKTFGKLAGNYLIESGRHVISRGGYTADVEVKRTAPATASGTAKKATPKGGLKVYGVKDNQVQVVGTSSISKKK